MSKASKLCDRCNGVTVASLSERYEAGDVIQYGYEHFPNFSGLTKSAATCSLCAMIAAAMGKKGQIVAADEDVISHPSAIFLVGFPLPTVEPEKVDSEGNTIPAKVIPAKLSSILVGNAFIRGWLSIYTHEDDPAAEGIDGRLIGPAPDWPQTRDLVRHWRSDCMANHLRCRRLISGKIMLEDQPVMPTYVIDVGEAGKAPKLLKIRPGIRGPYAALSHVWGIGNYTVQTTKNNVIQMQQAIDLASKESKSLIDAVAITRSLGLPYLWVDALCIVQDGPGFDAECARMGQIYENAQVTIAATGAANDHIGCLIPRATPKLAPVHIVTKLNQKISHIYINLLVGRLGKVVEEGIWASRGWTLQERILSRRIIHYAGEQVYWECATVTQSEDGVVIQHGNPKRLLYGTLDIPASTDKEEIVLCYERWNKLLAEYSTKTLSRPEDTLVALSGLAMEIFSRTGGKYLAGHWWDFLQIGLLWQAKSVPLSIPSPPRAPSWSWASRNGPIFHDPYVFSAQKGAGYAIESAKVTAQEEDVHGKTFSGSITLSGKMKQLTKMQGGIEGVWDQVRATTHEYSQNLDLLSALVDTEEDSALVGWGSFDTLDRSHFDTDTKVIMALCVSTNDPPTQPRSNSANGILPAAEDSSVVDGATEEGKQASPTPTFNVLLLQHAPGSTDKLPQYQRVGIGEITAEFWFDGVKAMQVVLV